MNKNYTKQISAIQPIISETSERDKRLAWFILADRATQKEFLQYLVAQGLAGHWHLLLSGYAEAQGECPKLFSSLERYMSAQQAIYFNQASVLGKINNLLEDNDIPYAAIKGAHIREVLYSPPWLRSCEDIDILISPKDRIRVAKLLSEHGFKARPDIKTITNDLSFSHGQVAVDVHWDILRPGRLKQPLTEFFLSTRIHQNRYFSLAPESTFFIMLVHPVFKKYLTTPYAYLSRVVDLHNWEKNHVLDWKDIFHLCDESGLKTAAWLTSMYYALLTDLPFNENFVNKIKPSIAKTAYLNFWLKYNLSTRFLDIPFIPQIFLTLAAHDSIHDSYRFLINNSKLKKHSFEELQSFQKHVGF